MKRRVAAAWVLGWLVMGTVPAVAGEFIGEKALALRKAFVPEGFDTNDTVEVVVSGELPTSCFKVSAVASQLAPDKRISITLTANEFSGECLAGPFRFFQTVSLGRLREAGEYRLVDGTTRGDLGALQVERAGQSGHGTDAVLYAPLTDAYLTAGGRSLRLVGAFPESCWELGRVEARRSADVLVVLPEARRDAEAGCEKGYYPFEREYPLEADLPPTPFLLHVRAFGGRAINKVIAAPPS